MFLNLSNIYLFGLFIILQIALQIFRTWGCHIYWHTCMGSLRHTTTIAKLSLIYHFSNTSPSLLLLLLFWSWTRWPAIIAIKITCHDISMISFIYYDIMLSWYLHSTRYQDKGISFVIMITLFSGEKSCLITFQFGTVICFPSHYFVFRYTRLVISIVKSARCILSLTDRPEFIFEFIHCITIASSIPCKPSFLYWRMIIYLNDIIM